MILNIHSRSQRLCVSLLVDNFINALVNTERRNARTTFNMLLKIINNRRVYDQLVVCSSDASAFINPKYCCVYHVYIVLLINMEKQQSTAALLH